MGGVPEEEEAEGEGEGGGEGEGEGDGDGEGGGEGEGGYEGVLGGTGLSSDSDEGGDSGIPVLPRPPREADVMVSRLPNILGVKTEAFDPDTYDEEAEADEFKFTTNIIRWRHKKDHLGRLDMGEGGGGGSNGLPARETNTRLVKQERARAEEALHKQARRKNNDYSKYDGDGGSGRRPNMDISYLEEGAFDPTSIKGMKNASRAGRYDQRLSEVEEDDDSEDGDRGMSALISERASKAAAARRRSLGSDDSDEDDDEEDDDEEQDRMPRKGAQRAAANRHPGASREEVDSDDDEEEDEGRGGGSGAGKRSRDEDDEGSPAPARGGGIGGKRIHRSIAEDSSESD
eukprot:jgi/Undpi1/2169/HiC_scaffold_12.g05555.m1